MLYLKKKPLINDIQYNQNEKNASKSLEIE